MQISSLGKASQKYKTAGLGVKGFDFREKARAGYAHKGKCKPLVAEGRLSPSALVCIQAAGGIAFTSG